MCVRSGRPALVFGIGVFLFLAGWVGGGTYAIRAEEGGNQTAERIRDENNARLMVEWMRAHGREPTEQDLSSNSYLRKLWDAYRRVEGRSEQRDRSEERRREQERDRRRNDTRARREYQNALDLFAAGRYPDAIRAFQEVLSDRDDAAYHQDARSKLQEMDQKGQDEIRQAQQLAAAHNYEKAFNQYLGVARRFRGLSCAGTAAKEYAALKNNPEVAAQIKKDRAASLLKRAEDALARKEYLNAVALFETLVQAYGDLQEAQTAKSRLETLQADKELWASILAQRAEAEARSLLSLATSYITMGMREKAVPRLQELIQKYPDGEQAKAARELLGDEPITTRPAS